MFKGIFVDDLDRVYAETLSTSGKLKFQDIDIKGAAVLAREIANERPSIVAIDYRLDEAPAALPPDQAYKGSALAQHLRDMSIETPDLDFALILVSAETKIETLYLRDQTAHDLFDHVYVKEEINKRREDVRRELISLCAGYEVLRSQALKYDILVLTAGREEDRPYVDVQEIRTKLKDSAAPHLAARVIFSLIKRNGPLLDTANVCAFLGIDLESSGKIMKTLREGGIAYDGVFGDGWARWWANRLDTWATGIFKRRATGLPAAERARLLSESTGQTIQPARSPWNNSADELISFACASCGRGTEIKHSVAAFEPTQPRYVRRRRICWDCIQTDQYRAKQLSVDDADMELAEQVKLRRRDHGQQGGQPS